MRIAVIFTCYNRSKKTQQCIKKIREQVINTVCKQVQFYICDDGSTDNTIAKIKELVPEATIITGGNLYWCKGMNIAMQAAFQDNNDFYLMINDDVNFYQTALSTMIKSYTIADRVCGIVGTTRSSNNGRITYGGSRFVRKSHIGSSNLLKPNGKLQECHIANWNCFLVPNEILKSVGLIDNYYEHAYGDYDYSLMMRRNGYPIFVATEVVGECERNSIIGTPLDKSLSKWIRLLKLFSKKERPIKSNIHFYYKNYRYKGLLYCLLKYCGAILKILFT
ncbi:glycosyltransferase family 2 protein [Sporolactobacillus nakayamae]|uniref:Glycosyltransferase, GT2 family n=1 Tax=Sporolactobacillus nakayamae TaxID=269670 RepID=A0A1I2VZB3_9BACL|nr:glycosyltransferase [Sporolactobacillus nakayamae]SFG94555.1 Glycosyltransferase, GT2 family [Sporolactobacillus nakayamae]